MSTENLTFDAQGRVTIASYATRANGAPPDSTLIAYSGLGAVLARDRRESPSVWEAEEFRVDGVGNVLSSRASSPNNTVNLPQTSTYTSRGALIKRVADPDLNFPVAFDSLRQTVDLAGHTIRSQHLVRDKVGDYTTDTPTRNYYGWDGMLRAVQRYNQLPGLVPVGIWEEYRYDAMGRRVMTIERKGAEPPACALAGMSVCARLCSTSRGAGASTT